MAFQLGNYAVKEIIYGVAQDFNTGDILYTLDQLTNASIEVSSDPTEITDKRGNIIRQIYNNKTATLTAQSALASPVLLNSQSGAPMEIAGTGANAIKMPKIVTVAPGATIKASDAMEPSIRVMGLYNNGANGKTLEKGTSAVVDQTFAFDPDTGNLTVPTKSADSDPDLYIVKYDRNVQSGLKMSNYADRFPDTVRLTLYVAIMDPCQGAYRAAYLYLPSFTPDPSVTIGFDSESQEIDYNGSVNLDFCGTEKLLYTVYFPDEDAVINGVTQ